jgi:hypothetical protein
MPERYPEDFNEVQSLERIEYTALDVVIRARNAQNAERGADREQWVESIRELVGSLQTQMQYHDADYGANAEDGDG